MSSECSHKWFLAAGTKILDNNKLTKQEYKKRFREVFRYAIICSLCNKVEWKERVKA